MLQEASGLKVVEWLDMELPEVQVRRADLIAGTEEGPILHVDLQSTNDANMALRMLEYALRIYRKWQQFPRQIVLYVGDGKLTMSEELLAPTLFFQYRLIDFRHIDGLPLLKSERIEDNLLAILAKLPDVRDAIRQILIRIARMEEPARKDALVRFLILSNLRHYGGQGPQTLDATQYRFLDMQHPNTGAATISPNNVFVNFDGPYMTYSPTPGQTGPFGRYWTQGQFRGFILLHELGHHLSPTTGFKPDANSPLNQQQSRQVLSVCF